MQNISEKIEALQSGALAALFEWAGSQHNLAVLLGISDQVVAQWKVRGRISKAGAEQVELLTKGSFTQKMMRPTALDVI